jgi:hypothetical protein
LPIRKKKINFALKIIKSLKKRNMLKLPYGESNFTKVMVNDYFYQDRTAYIRDLEAGPTFVYYLRPRRFGKSLFVSMLRHYYGLEFQPKFDQLFGKLDIGEKPTPLANQYMILIFEFSGIYTNTPENTERGFLKNVREGVASFLDKYTQFFPEDIHATILNNVHPNEIIYEYKGAT